MPELRPAPPPIPAPRHGVTTSPLASSTPPPLSLASVRAMAAIPGAELPPDMLVAMRAVLITQGNAQLTRELEAMFDLETGRARTI